MGALLVGSTGTLYHARRNLIIDGKSFPKGQGAVKLPVGLQLGASEGKCSVL